MCDFKLMIKTKKVKEVDPDKVAELAEKRRLRKTEINKQNSELIFDSESAFAALARKLEKEEKQIAKQEAKEQLLNINKTLKNLIGYSIDEINEKINQATSITVTKVGGPDQLDVPKKSKSKKSKSKPVVEEQVIEPVIEEPVIEEPVIEVTDLIKAVEEPIQINKKKSKKKPAPIAVFNN